MSESEEKATDHRRRIETLIELAAGSYPGDCWDGDRAEQLLRLHSCPEELQQMGAAPALIERIWPERHGG